MQVRALSYRRAAAPRTRTGWKDSEPALPYPRPTLESQKYP